jgi:poly-gamma-glutamate biosynthesis protein PgsC/CapC
MIASFVLTETVGLAAGGIVVPGYFALTLGEPVRVFATLAVAFVTYLIVKLVSLVALVHGRRMMLLGVLVGYVLGYVTKIAPPFALDGARLDVSVIGYVIPGLVAYWMHRQGVVETLATMFTAAVLTRLVMTVVSRGAF